MSVPPPELEQSDAMLAEAAKSDLIVMRHVQGLVLDATEAAEVGTLVHAYARASRAMRQNLALLAKQKADRERLARERAREAARDAVYRPLKSPETLMHEARVEARAEVLSQAMGRVISAAAEGDRRLHADWAHRFDRELDDWCDTEDLLGQPLDAQVRRACRTLGLPDDLAARWRGLPEPDFVPDPESRDEDEDLEEDLDDDAADAEAEANAETGAETGAGGATPADPWTRPVDTPAVAPTHPGVRPPPWRSSG
ncbi:MAG: hypothetical protein U1C74_14885 [Phenylobacterium sp.]|nr:hypothetical protein [Phenylobacterium sp.]